MSYSVISLGLFIFIMAFFSTSQSFQDTMSSIFPPYTQLAESSPQPLPSIEPIQFCQSVDSGTTITFTAPRDDNTKCPNGPGGSYKSGGVDPDNIFGEETTYRLIKQAVPLNRSFFTKEDNSDHSTLASDVGINTSLDPAKYRLYFPQISGEINLGQAPYSRTRDCGDKSYEHTGRMYFIDYGLAFALILKDGKPIEVNGTAIGGGQSTFWLADVFKDINREDEIPTEAFTCSSSTASNPTANSPISVNFPAQDESPDKTQLQLQYFVFDQNKGVNLAGSSVTNGWVDTCKPAIYLYPSQPQIVNVKVFPQGFLTYTDPPYPTSGWTVTAYPNGTLYNLSDSSSVNGNYLYYESKIFDSVIKKPESGWVRSYDELTNLYQEILPKLGLNPKQQADFIEYWNKALPKAPYYFVGIVDQSNVDQIERLEITPKPDSINRVRIYFERLDSPKIVPQPNLSSISNFKFQISNSRFSVVEWGGMVKNNPNHPFTCSQ